MKDKQQAEKRLMKSERKNEYLRDSHTGGLHASVRKIKARELGIGVKVGKEAVEKYPGQLLAQIDYLIDNLPMQSAIGRPRRMSNKSVDAYRKRLRTGIAHLRKLNIRPESIFNITTRQIDRFFEMLMFDGRSPSYLASMNTTFRRLGVWLNSPDLCLPLKYHTDDARLIRRQTAATSPKDWGMPVAEMEEIFSRVEKYCEVAATQLRIALHFGCRVEEVLCAKPAEMIKYGTLHILAGTKGGRSRVVPIETPEQKSVLAKAIELSEQNRDGLLSIRARLTLLQAKKRFYRILAKAGVNQKGFGVVAHGLRHAYACAAYTRLTGVEPPVLGGPRIDPDLEFRVRKEVTMRMGHSRTSIVSAYLGSHLGMDRARSKQIKFLLTRLDGDEVLKEQANEMAAKEIFILGAPADGERLDPTTTVVIGVNLGGGPRSNIFKAFGSRVKVLLNCGMVLVSELQEFDANISRLELTGLTGAHQRGGQTLDAAIAAIRSEATP